MGRGMVTTEDANLMLAEAARLDVEQPLDHDEFAGEYRCLRCGWPTDNDCPRCGSSDTEPIETPDDWNWNAA